MRQRNAEEHAGRDPFDGFLEADEGQGATAIGVWIAVADAFAIGVDGERLVRDPEQGAACWNTRFPGNVERTGGRTLQETVVEGFRSAASGREMAADQLLDIFRRMQASTGMDMDVLDVRRNGLGGWGGVDLPPFADGVFEAGTIAGVGIGGNESDTAAFRSDAADAGTGATSGLGDNQNAHEPPFL